MKVLVVTRLLMQQRPWPFARLRVVTIALMGLKVKVRGQG